MFRNNLEYQPLIDNNCKEEIEFQRIYQNWLERMRKKLNTRKSKTIIYGITSDLVKDYEFIFKKLLCDLNESENYIVYHKKVKLFNDYDIKIKPTNELYKKNIREHAHTTWNRVHHHFHKEISKNPRSRHVIAKRTNDKALAGWYKSVLDNAFVDYVVQVLTVAPDKFHVVINCNINVNINVN